MSLRPPNDGRRPSSENALRSFSARGTIELPDGQRAAVVPLDFLTDLRHALAQEFGDGARHLLYCTGFDWSLRDMVGLGQRLRDDVGGGQLDLWQMDAKLVLDAWWQPLADAGWGRCSFSALPRGLMLAELNDSASAASAASGATAPTCDLCAGLFAGALSFLARAECHAVEVQCAALGHPACLFIGGASPQIDRVETWQQQNLSAAEIRQRLASLSDAAA